jgi:hypothetical protein
LIFGTPENKDREKLAIRKKGENTWRKIGTRREREPEKVGNP